MLHNPGPVHLISSITKIAMVAREADIIGQMSSVHVSYIPYVSYMLSKFWK